MLKYLVIKNDLGDIKFFSDTMPKVDKKQITVGKMVVSELNQNNATVLALEASTLPTDWATAYYRYDPAGIGLARFIKQGDITLPPSDPIILEDTLYVSIVVTGGDGLMPPGILNDAKDNFLVILTLQDDLGNTLPINRSFRVTVRPVRGGRQDDIFVTFTSGVARFNYGAQFDGYPTGEYYFDPTSVEDVLMDLGAGLTRYRFVFERSPRFKLYRTVKEVL